MPYRSHSLNAQRSGLSASSELSASGGARAGGADPQPIELRKRRRGHPDFLERVHLRTKSRGATKLDSLLQKATGLEESRCALTTQSGEIGGGFEQMAMMKWVRRRLGHAGGTLHPLSGEGSASSGKERAMGAMDASVAMHLAAS